jgi:hypothetical protein
MNILVKLSIQNFEQVDILVKLPIQKFEWILSHTKIQMGGHLGQITPGAFRYAHWSTPFSSCGEVSWLDTYGVLVIR